jgi:hypothetical protein
MGSRIDAGFKKFYIKTNTVMDIYICPLNFGESNISHIKRGKASAEYSN